MGELRGGTTIGGYTALHSGLKEAYLGGNLTLATDKHIIFGPNSTWGGYLSVGGNNANTASNQGSVFVSNGNLHFDAGTSSGTYLNWFSGTDGIKFGNAAQTAIGSMDTSGNFWANGTIRSSVSEGASFKIPGGGEIHSGYSNTYILKDHNNGHVTLGAAGGSLYLGYNSANNVKLWSNLVSNDSSGNVTIASTNGTLYYQGQDTDSRYINSGGDTITGTLYASSNSYDASYQSSAVQLREYNLGGVQSDNWSTAPRIAFHWSGRIASQIGMDSSGQICILNNPGTASEKFRAGYTTVDGMTSNGDITMTGNLNLNNTSINNVIQINGQYGKIAQSRSDEWLGINDDTSHTAGVYFGNSTTRTDGELQVGSNGTYFKANNGATTIGTFDLRLGSSDQTTRGDTGTSRALVKDNNSTLVLNFAGDFTGGARIDSDVTINKPIPGLWFSVPGRTNTSGILWNANASSNYGLTTKIDGVDAMYLTAGTGGGITLPKGQRTIRFDSDVNYGSDYGYLGYWPDDNTYAWWGDSNENASLVLGIENDGMNASSDVVVLKSKGAVILDCVDAFVAGHRVYRHWDNIKWGSGAPSGGQDGDIWIQI